MAERESPLDGILEENTIKEKEAKPLPQAAVSSNHKPADEPGPSNAGIRQLRDIQASDAQYLAARIKQLEAMVMALRMIVGVTALAAAYSVWKVRKLDPSPRKLKNREAVVEIEEVATPTLETPA